MTVLFLNFEAEINFPILYFTIFDLSQRAKKRSILYLKKKKILRKPCQRKKLNSLSILSMEYIAKPLSYEEVIKEYRVERGRKKSIMGYVKYLIELCSGFLMSVVFFSFLKFVIFMIFFIQNKYLLLFVILYFLTEGHPNCRSSQHHTSVDLPVQLS